MFRRIIEVDKQMTTKQLEKLDRKVAEALGWTKIKYECLSFKEKNLKFLNKSRLVGLSPGNFRKQFVPHFTLNLAYAWKCVEFARKHDILVSINTYDNSIGVEFTHKAKPSVIGVAFHEALSMSICLAFLDLNKSL